MEMLKEYLEDVNMPAEKQIELCLQEWQRMRAERLYWILKAMTLVPIYIKHSIPNSTTFCNVASLDVFGESATVWRKRVKVGETETPMFGMGNEIHAFDYQVEVILRDDNPNNVLIAPISFLEEEVKREAEKGNVQLITPKMAQDFANIGIPIMVLSAALKHVAVVAPNLQWSTQMKEYIMVPFNEELGPFLGNVGAFNGMFYIGDTKAFGGHSDYLANRGYLGLLYVQFKRRDGTFDTL